MKSFIRAAEIWLPAQDHTLLEFGAGHFGDALSFAAVSQAMCFGRAEGLPGEAWDVGHPVLLKQFEGSHFRRAGAAKVAGLTCAVAVPYFKGGVLTAVVTLFGAAGEDSKGAMELWRHDPRISSDIRLQDGYYGHLPAEFEQLSRDAYLPRGAGLPGMAWQRDEVIVAGQLGASTHFLRGEAASDAGICRALAMPCPSLGHDSHVLMLLSGAVTPIARRMARWTVDSAARQLVLAGGYDELDGVLPAGVPRLNLDTLDTVLASVLSSGRPALMASTPDRDACLWLPVLVEDQVTELLALHL